MVKINTTHALLAGGYDEHVQGYATSAAYIFSNDQGFVRVGDMTQRREHAACGLHGTSYVIMAGGQGSGSGSGSAQLTSEYFSLDDMRWHQGPAIGKDVGKDPGVSGGKIVSTENETFLFGQFQLFQLDTDADEWKWVVVRELLNYRKFYDAFLMPSFNCRGDTGRG